MNRVKPWSDEQDLWAIIVAAGSGTRFGGLKQMEMLAGSPMLNRSVEAMGCHGRSIVVLPEALLGSVSVAGARCVAGGASRSDSVRAGLAALGPAAKRVLIHDAARPLVSDAVVARVIDALGHAPGVIPVVPMTDTLRSHDGEPLDRADYVAVQTPQGFDVAAIRSAHMAGDDASDDASLVSAAGGTVVHVAGDPNNLKITVRDDLLIAEALLRAERSKPTTERSELAGETSMEEIRVGQGFDVHPWSDDRSRILVLGGVHFAGVRGLVGHSDADVVAHALADALLGAAGLGDIGQLFPDTDQANAGANSIGLLTATAEELAKHGWRTLNGDCTVIVDEPKLAPHRIEMQALLSKAIGAPVSVKGKRTEGVSGLQGGITSHAVALIARDGLAAQDARQPGK